MERPDRTEQALLGPGLTPVMLSKHLVHDSVTETPSLEHLATLHVLNMTSALCLLAVAYAVPPA